jgi:hypothetical protein
MGIEDVDDLGEIGKRPGQPIASLLRIIARAHHIQARLIQNPKLTVHDIAREEQVSAAYLYSLLRLRRAFRSANPAFPSPSILCFSADHAACAMRHSLSSAA